MTLSDSGIVGPREFPSTSWSAVRHLRAENGEALARHLTHLAELYWRPVHCVIRYRWSRTVEEAKDLTQEFFARVLLDPAIFRSYSPERGSFRAFLRGAIENFMNKVVRDGTRLKRGGGARVVALEGAALEMAELISDDAPPTPEELFDAAWDGFVLREALERLRVRLESDGRADHFDLFHAYDLEGDARSHEELAAERGWTVRKLRRVLSNTRALLRDSLAEIACTYVEGPDALDEEVRRLLGE